MKRIPIAIAFDENYLMPSCVMLTSLFENACETTAYAIYVFATGKVAELADMKFKQLFSAYPRHEYRFIDPQDAFAKTGQTKGHLTLPNYYRFLIPDFIENHGKALWIDVDTVIKKDLSSVFETDLGENYVGAVAIGDPASKVAGVPYADYYNAGFMLLNLDLWRKDRLADRIGQLIEETHFNCPTQDPCNLATCGKTLYLPFEYNTLISKKIIQKQELFLEFNNLSSFSEAVNNAAVLHFVDKTKPWIYRNQPFFGEWLEYYNRSIYKGTRLRQRWLFTEKIKRFLYQKKRTTKKRTVVKIFKIPVYVGRAK